MSFILDALRKSDQQRRRSATPTLLTVQAPAPEARQPAMWWYGLLAAVLVGAGILIGWMHQWQAEPATPALSAGADESSAASAKKYTPMPFPVFTEPAKKPEFPHAPRESTALAQAVATPSGADKPADLTAKPAAPAGQQPAPAASSPKEAAPAAARQEEPARPRPSEAAREPGVIPWSELPPALQQEIAKLSILAHSYSSKPKSRFVFINDQMWHEEEYPAPGLKLEQITLDGMIFSYKGYRFRRSANP